MPRLEDLSGKRFEKLVVIKRAPNAVSPSGAQRTKWLCRCDCGTYKEIGALELKSGRTKSCGCLQKELAAKRLKKYNTYDLSQEYGIGYTTKGEIFYFDKEDYEKIKDYCWFINNSGYVYAKNPAKDGGGHILMHQLIFGEGHDVDHKYGNRFDNRKEFLRLTNDSTNQMNKSIQRNNKSGCPGVIWHKRDKCWEVNISKNNKQYYIGRFDKFDDAVIARKKAEDEYFGDWSYSNSRKLTKGD